MAFPEISQQDVWWRHVVPDNPLPAMALGARIRQDALQYGLQVEELKIKQQQMEILTQERVAKLQLQSKIMAGSAELADTLADPEFDWNDPESIKRGYEVFSKNPALMGTGVFQGFEKMHQNAVSAQLKATAQSERTAQINERLRILGEHYENVDEVARLKQEMAEVNALADSEYKFLRAAQIEEQAARLQRDQDLKTKELERRMALMSPEKRILLKNELQALENESFGGKVLDPDTGEQSATEYKRRKALIQQKYFGQSNNQTPATSAPAQAPAATAPLPMPATKSELKQGQQYNTARGVATWDGEKFVQ